MRVIAAGFFDGKIMDFVSLVVISEINLMTGLHNWEVRQCRMVQRLLKEP